MSDVNNPISPWWPSFSRLWWIVLIALLLLMLALQLLGYGWGRLSAGGNCAAKPAITSIAPVVESAPVTAGITDTLAPTISLNDASTLRLPVNSDFTDPGASATDETDGNITVTTSGNVDTSTLGEYVITYTATDVTGNVSTATRTIYIEPRQAAVSTPTARLYFGNDQDDSPSDPGLLLSDVIAHLRSNPASRAIISGFHSSTGNYDYNQDLSKRRAQNISLMLQQAGIDSDRIVQEKPVETTGDGSAEEARRVEVSISQ